MQSIKFKRNGDKTVSKFYERFYNYEIFYREIKAFFEAKIFAFGDSQSYLISTI